MPRQPRIEFPGALYHVLARGNRRGDIFEDDADKSRFLASLAKLSKRLGWEVRAWVLMDNHYHLALHTPQANLVEGMTWLQNSYTRYYNTRHQLWGHLFGGRYKSVIVDPEGDYQSTLIDYIHLNPGRAKMAAPTTGLGLLSYKWSSLTMGYAMPPSKRPTWLETKTGFALVGAKDTTSGRRRYVARLEQLIIAGETGADSLLGNDTQTLQSTMQRGWYWGSQAFREQMLALIPKEKVASNRNYKTSPVSRDKAVDLAEQLVVDAIKDLELETTNEGTPLFFHGDTRRGALACLLWRNADVSQTWIANRLGLSSAANVSQQMRRFEATPEKNQSPQLRKWMKLHKLRDAD